MYALVEIKGKQYKAEEGAKITVDLLGCEAGSTYEIDKVLAIVKEDGAVFGTPYINGATVTATVGEVSKGEKIKVYKFHRRKGYRRTQGHREQYQEITISSIKG
ncbi:MAG TPA: 50S ribosomal protein L21 [Candidatus Ornithospirochaeta avicola]|uniref:Large ribosomal subunit protein bL21 n=1 Tax=Candidatus Ornithospirochaeta avicola TaxID=2840896 RepID=A0A9D1PVQ0_9SPIO|nr:50S ribosomal protein L21 [Candidatus Ornithospirochaeta avicola]